MTQRGGHVEGEVEGQGEADQHVGHGQRQDEHVGDDAAESSAEAQRKNRQSIASKDGDHKDAVDDGPEDDVRLDGQDTVTGRTIAAHWRNGGGQEWWKGRRMILAGYKDRVIVECTSAAAVQ